MESFFDDIEGIISGDDSIYSELPDFSNIMESVGGINELSTAADAALGSFTGFLDLLIPLVTTFCVIFALWLILPVIINKIRERNVFSIIRSGEEIPNVLHSCINKKKYVPDELLRQLLYNAEEVELSYTVCNKYAEILRNRAKVKHYFDRELCIMLEVRRCKSYKIDITKRQWYIEIRRNRLTRLNSFKGHFYLKAGELILKTDEKTYTTITGKAVIVVFETAQGAKLEVFAPMNSQKR
jgi:hypothetical protein